MREGGRGGREGWREVEARVEGVGDRKRRKEMYNVGTCTCTCNSPVTHVAVQTSSLCTYYVLTDRLESSLATL